jgi:ubiquitin C-terminal hydrolase
MYYELYVNKNNVVPRNMLRYFQENIKLINIFEQNDINEFLAILIDKLNQCVGKSVHITKEALLDKNRYSTSDFDIQRFKMDVDWYEKHSKEYSALVPMFNGQSISQIVCGSCGKVFHNYETYMNLMLPITENTKTLYDCFDEYFSEEIINRDCAVWECSACKEKVSSRKTMKLWRNPSVLIVSLKRFTNDFRKNNAPIDIPEQLDLSKYSLTQKTNSYRLQAVAYHNGSQNSGHYHAVCRHDDKWFEYDDMDVRCFKETPEHKNGYVFFYCLSSLAKD